MSGISRFKSSISGFNFRVFSFHGVSIHGTLHLWPGGQILKSVMGLPSQKKRQMTWGAVHPKWRNLSFLTLINVNNYIKVPASSQMLPGSDLETMRFPFLGEPSSAVCQPSRDWVNSTELYSICPQASLTSGIGRQSFLVTKWPVSILNEYSLPLESPLSLPACSLQALQIHLSLSLKGLVIPLAKKPPAEICLLPVI